jgi:hypothetical protein
MNDTLMRQECECKNGVKFCYLPLVIVACRNRHVVFRDRHVLTTVPLSDVTE